ncbi:MAG: tyrosine-protein phosphatase, partial [Clostridia bacterium]|nr:tyrosine-protein phosphatase [Clostridia bacterium]
SSSGGQSSEKPVSFYFVSDASKLHTDLQLSYIADDYSNVAKYADGTKELSKPESATIRWQTSGKATDCELYISDDADFNDYLTVPVKANTVTVSNLKVRTKYYYKLKATVKGVTATSDAQTFVTESTTPRFIDCDGVTNMRDLGGYNAKGGVVKQGLIYRCGRLNASESRTLQVEITQKGIQTMRDLGIRSEIDLRLTKLLYGSSDIREVGGLTDKSVIGDDVNYYQCPMEYENGVYSSVNYAQIRNVFAVLADRANYPLIFHCNIGTDRTGYIAYLLNGLLGVSKDDLVRDYLFSNFGKIGGARSESNIVPYVTAINNCEGGTLSEKVEKYLTGVIGVPKAHLDSIKDILIEEHSYTDAVITQATCRQEGVVLHTCTDDDALTWYENVGYGEHDYEATSDPKVMRCKLCGHEKAETEPGVLPVTYTAVDYIESSGTQYIDTGFIPNSNTRVVAKIDFKPETDGNSHNAFSATPGERTAEYGFLTNGSDYVSRYGDDVYLSIAYPNKPFVIDMDKNVLKIDGETVYTHEQKEFACGCTMYVFTCDKSGASYRPSSMKLYSMDIYDDGTLVRSFVACYRDSDSEIGLYDLINGVFYTNSGTGKFTCGNDADQPTGPVDPPTPTTGKFEDDYTVVEYIQSSGTQYIDTGFTPNSNTRVVAEIDLVTVSDVISHIAFSATPGVRSKEYGFLTNGSDYVSRYGDDIYLEAFSYPNKPFVVDMDKNVLKIDGETVYTHEQKEFACGCTMYIFTCNKNGSSYRPSSMKLYSMKIYDNGVLVRDFVPCYRNSDNKVGLYDKVNGVFYTNIGTGEFTYGQAVL